MTNQSDKGEHRQAAEALQELLRVVAKLRDPQGGCPWDLKQTFASLRPLVLDEAYEVVDAVGEGDAEVCEELGDLLSLIALFSQIASEEKRFSFATVAQGIADKLVRRHPHVFGDLSVSSTEEVLKNWEAIKQRERKEAKKERKGLLDGVPRSMPALARSYEVGRRCKKIGFDWGSTQGVAEKIKEELGEFLDELPAAGQDDRSAGSPAAPPAAAIEEFGDLIFSLVQYGRHLGINAEEALELTNKKFLSRFGKMEELAREELGLDSLDGLTTEALENLWNQAKKLS
jgi:MazG family protein